MSNNFAKFTIILGMIGLPIQIFMIASDNDRWLYVVILLLTLAGMGSARDTLRKRQKQSKKREVN